MNRVEICGVDISQLPKLKPKQQLEMLDQIKNGDNIVRSKFIIANFRLVLSVIQKFIKHSCNDDVFQVGCIGLIKAIDNFNPQFKVQFSTYAVPMILGEIKRYLRDTNSLRVSRSMRDTAYKALTSKEKLTKLLFREPTIEEIAEDLNLPYSSIYFALNATSTLVSLNETVNEEGGKALSLLDNLSDEQNTSDNWLENNMLNKTIENLDEREKEILRLRYYSGKTQIEVSEEIGISQAQVSRLEKNALAHIKKKLK